MEKAERFLTGQKMMGHETLQMIHERYYSYIKNYQRDDGSAFMQNVYNPINGEKSDDISENVAQMWRK